MNQPVKLGTLPDTPLVSVIIPCYNQGHFLPVAIESALAQTHGRVEIVVVDDGSADDTSRVAASYKGVRCVRQENRGLAGARNRGFQESAGECLVFLDADDRLRPRAIELGILALRRCQDAAFSYGRCAFVDVDGHFIALAEGRIIEGDHYPHLLGAYFLPSPSALMFRRAALDALGGFKEGVRGCEDYDLVLRLTQVYTASGYPDVVVDYRQHGTSLSRNIALMSDSMLKVIQSQVTYVSGHEEYQDALRRGMRKWRRGYYTEKLVTRARQHAREGRWGLVARDALSLVRANPRMLFENALRKVRVKWARNKWS